MSRAYKVICISMYTDDLAAVDAFVEGSPGLDRSKLIRLALGTVGVLAERPVRLPTATIDSPRVFSDLVAATFALSYERRQRRRGVRVAASFTLKQRGDKPARVTARKRRAPLPTRTP